MGFFGDIGKGLAAAGAGAVRFIRSDVGRVAVPLVAGAVGGPGAALTAQQAQSILVPRRPTRRPQLVRSLQGPTAGQLVRRTPTAAVRRRIAPAPRRRTPPIVTVGPPTPRRAPIAARPAGMRMRVPPAVRERAQALGRFMPFTFGDGPAAGGRGTFGPITPISETVDKFGRPLVVEAKQEERLRCPPGYLAITMPDGSRACALAGPAISAGLARRRRKPLISVKETRALQLAGRAQRKIDRVHKRFGSKPRTRRRAPRRS